MVESILAGELICMLRMLRVLEDILPDEKPLLSHVMEEKQYLVQRLISVILSNNHICIPGIYSESKKR